MKINRKFIFTHWQEIILGIFILLYTVYFSYFTFSRHDNLYSMRYDLGNMDQTVFNTYRGRIFTMTEPKGITNVSRLMYHADIFLILLAPLYFIYADPKTLLFVQSLTLALGALFVYLLAKDILKNRNASLVFAVSYLLYPAMQRANIYEFHAVTLGTTFLLGAFYFAYKRKYPLFYLFSLLAASTKEEISLLIAGIALYIFIRNKNKIIGTIVFLLSFLWFFICVRLIIPHYRLGDEHFAVGFFSEFGDDPGEIIRAIIRQPLKVISKLFSGSKPIYLYQLLVPVSFLSLFSPLILIALPELGINLLSSSTPMQTIYYQYTSGITPFIYIAAIFGYKNLVNKIPRYRHYFLLLLFAGTIYSAFTLGPLPFSKKADLIPITKTNKYASIVKETRKLVPENASISVTNNIAPHFTHRKDAYSFPYMADHADYLVILAQGSWENLKPEELKAKAEEYASNPDYLMVIGYDNYYILQKVQ